MDDTQRPRGVMWELTPGSAFAAGALLASALGMAFVLGQRLPRLPETKNQTTSDAPRTIEQVRRTPPIRYDELPVDRGALK